MNLILFIGPSLPSAERWRFGMPGLHWLPPARQGDLYRAARQRPDGIGLVDGTFESTLSVWHKEILWALSQGIPVWGASSMGALRAAELFSFGMQGVGRIFQAYRDGELLDDAEVAVLHAPAELGYATLSEAIVNIRATAEAARRLGMLNEDEAEHLIAIANAIFFKYRTWDAILARLPAALRSTLASWLPVGAVNQKRDDAIAMIATMCRDGAQSATLARHAWTLAYTAPWDAALRRMDTSASDSETSSGPRDFVRQ